MKLVPLDREIETPENIRYLVRRQHFVPSRNRRGETRYYWPGYHGFGLPRRLNWLWRRLAGR